MSAEAGRHTRREIFQQPALWPTTLNRVDAASHQFDLKTKLAGKRILFTGAGTSAYAAHAVAVADRRCLAVPTTDLLLDAERVLAGADVLISLARSGNSPESAAVVERVHALRPDLPQYAITCNADSKLTRAKLNGVIFLDPRSNDESLVMTSAFSNLVLAGLALLKRDAAGAAVAACAPRAQSLLAQIDQSCHAAASKAHDRIVILSSSPLFGWADEARLKVLEMTAGAYPAIAETFLGLRHGPMSFVREDTLVLALLSNDPQRRLYERDLLKELRAKKLGTLVGIAGDADGDLFDAMIPAVAAGVADALRTPFEIIAPQLLGYHLSLMKGLDPDNPSPSGVINRVVQGVIIHPATPSSSEAVGHKKP
jgi:tagatose-6-phosphate ketose/aldose isomerase